MSSSSSPPPLPQSPPFRPSRPEAQGSRDQFLREQIERAEAAVSAKRFHEAAGICQDVLEVERDYPPALALLGGIIGHRGDLARGIGLIERAIRKDRSVAAWFSNLSGLYRMQYRIEEAVLAAREAVRLAPQSARYLITLGKALIDQGNRDEAIVAFLLALAREPANAEAHLAIGQILLAQGEWRPGWLEYEWRNHLEQAKGMLPPMTAPAWNGMPLPRSAAKRWFWAAARSFCRCFGTFREWRAAIARGAKFHRTLSTLCSPACLGCLASRKTAFPPAFLIFPRTPPTKSFGQPGLPESRTGKACASASPGRGGHNIRTIGADPSRLPNWRRLPG